MIQSRRKFLFWLGKAPAIVAASSIMPIVMRRPALVDIGFSGLIYRPRFYAGQIVALGEDGRYGLLSPNTHPERPIGVVGSVNPDGSANVITHGFASTVLGQMFVSRDPSVDLIPINRNDGFIRHRVVART